MAFKDNSTEEEKEGKFNAGIDTLKDIAQILKELRNLSIRGHFPEYNTILPIGKAQHCKVKMIKQLFMRCVPLIEAEKVQVFKDRINNLKVAWLCNGLGNSIVGNVDKPVSKGYYESFNPKLDSIMDDIEIDIIISMQAEGKYFMPSKEDYEGL